MIVNLQSSVNLSESITQIIHFVGGEKRTYNGIIPKTIKQGQFTKFHTVDGKYVLVNDKNVLCIEVFDESYFTIKEEK